MVVTSYASACGPAIGVQAFNVDKGDDFATAMEKEARRLCPMGYEQLSTHTENDGKTVTWPIRCRTSQSAAAEPVAPNCAGHPGAPTPVTQPR
jgi:hypothetical protein